jgi:hypothetical protein
MLYYLCIRWILTEQENDADAFFAAYDSARDKHLRTFLTKIDYNALTIIASKARGGTRCRLPAVSGNGNMEPTVDPRMVSDQMGGQNCHLDVEFEDGTVWIARLRLEEPTVLPRETQEKILASEVATLRFLARTNIPVPKVFYHSSGPSEIGTPFMLMEKMAGSPLQWSKCSAQQRTQVMEQLVEIFLELEKHPLGATGSLTGNGTVGPYAQSHTFFTPSLSLGPFETAEKALTSIIKHEIEMVRSGELSTLAVDNYLTHLWRLERIPELLANATDGSFYIKHFDDKGDHILVDDQHNITGIVDWEFASAECKPFAFSSPCMMWPVGEYYEGINRLSVEEIEFANMFRSLEREDMAQIILQGRKYQRFMFFLGTAVSVERKEFEDLFQALRQALDGQSIESYSEWRSAVIARNLKDDPGLCKQLTLVERQNQGSS